MRALRLPAVFLVTLLTGAFNDAQDMAAIRQLWQQTLNALHEGRAQQAQEEFGEFNQRTRQYVTAHGRDWQIEYLAGSLDCQFAAARANGAELLNDVLQNSLALNSAGGEEVRRQLAACKGGSAATVSNTVQVLPVNVADGTAHFQAPGVRGNMKGGYDSSETRESAARIDPLSAAVLRNRLALTSQPQKALSTALREMPAGSNGDVVQGFAVVMRSADKDAATGIGRCLVEYMPGLRREFDIDAPKYMITVYAADYTMNVYDYARKLHGLTLPQGVVAYSVAEDMSLSAVGGARACGSMAHELVHLLIKQNFPMSPAWLEEGLASEVAVAQPKANGFKFGYSWRDDTLKTRLEVRPTVAELLNLSWDDLNAASIGQIQQAAARQAMAAVFIRYLDAKGKLQDVYFAVRDHHMNHDLTGFSSYQQILEEKLGMNVVAIDRDFEQWFAAQEAPARSYADSCNPNVGNSPPCMTPSLMSTPNEAAHPQVMNQMNRPPSRPAEKPPTSSLPQ
jgi:hypothetical protein